MGHGGKVNSEIFQEFRRPLYNSFQDFPNILMTFNFPSFSLRNLSLNQRLEKLVQFTPFQCMRFTGFTNQSSLQLLYFTSLPHRNTIDINECVHTTHRIMKITATK